MIAKIAVSAASFAIDKPYSYWVPEGMELRPGIRVSIPFGRGNRRCEGVVLSLEEGSPEKLKAVEKQLDDVPLLDMTMLKLASFMRERYFCTLYDAVRAMLPGGYHFESQDSFTLTEDRTWEEKPPRQENALKLLRLLADLGGQGSEDVLADAVPDEEEWQAAIDYLLKKK